MENIIVKNLEIVLLHSKKNNCSLHIIGFINSIYSFAKVLWVMGLRYHNVAIYGTMSFMVAAVAVAVKTNMLINTKNSCYQK